MSRQKSRSSSGGPLANPNTAPVADGTGAVPEKGTPPAFVATAGEPWDDPGVVEKYAQTSLDMQAVCMALALCCCVALALSIYCGLGLMVRSSLLAQPNARNVRLAQAWLQWTYIRAPAISSFVKFKAYILKHRAISEDFCFNLASVICESFLAIFPDTSYEDFLGFGHELFKDFVPSSNISVSHLEWRPMVDRISVLKFTGLMTSVLHDHFEKCVNAVLSERRTLLQQKRWTTAAELPAGRKLSDEFAKHLAAGVCRIQNEQYFNDRADMLWKFCLAGCGRNISEQDDWSALCDTLHFLMPDLRAFHRCSPSDSILPQCKPVLDRRYCIPR